MPPVTLHVITRLSYVPQCTGTQCRRQLHRQHQDQQPRLLAAARHLTHSPSTGEGGSDWQTGVTANTGQQAAQHLQDPADVQLCKQLQSKWQIVHQPPTAAQCTVAAAADLPAACLVSKPTFLRKVQQEWLILVHLLNLGSCCLPPSADLLRHQLHCCCLLWSCSGPLPDRCSAARLTHQIHKEPCCHRRSVEELLCQGSLPLCVAASNSGRNCNC